MSAEEDPAQAKETPPRVISIRTRGPWEPPAEPAPPLQEGEVDEYLVEVLEHLLADAKKGEIQGLTAITWDGEAGSFRRIVQFARGQSHYEAGVRFMGGLDTLKEAILDVMDNYMAAMRGEFEEMDEDDGEGEE